MVVPYQMWMLGRLHEVLTRAVASPAGRGAVEELLGRIAGGSDLLTLRDRLAGCRVVKRESRIHSVG